MIKSYEQQTQLARGIKVAIDLVGLAIILTIAFHIAQFPYNHRPFLAMGSSDTRVRGVRPRFIPENIK
jgi:hypothetical protein